MAIYENNMIPRKISLSDKSAFTLIELLVVIAIISLLVSILVPSLTKAKELAKLTICATQLRSLGVASHTFAAENDGDFPYPDSSYPDGTHGGRYDVSSPEAVSKNFFCRPLMELYGCTPKMFYCPIVGYKGPWEGWDAGTTMDFHPLPDTWKHRVIIDYCYFGWTNGNYFINDDEYASPRNVEDAHSKWVLMCDQCRWWTSSPQTNHYGNSRADSSNNVLRVDQSVELHRPDNGETCEGWELQYYTAAGGRCFW